MSPKHLLLLKVPQEALSAGLKIERKKKKPAFLRFLCLVTEHQIHSFSAFALKATLSILSISPEAGHLLGLIQWD